MFAVIENPYTYTDGSREISGKILSQHRTAKAAWAAHDKAQRACARANPGCHLDLDVVEVVAAGERARGPRAARP